MEAIQSWLASAAPEGSSSPLPAIRIPNASDSVYNRECVYTFQSPFHHGGLWVSLSSWVGTAPHWAGLQVTDSATRHLWLRIVQERQLKPQEEADAPQKLAIGVPGGFALDRYTVASTYSVILGEVHMSKQSSASASLPTVHIVKEWPYNSDTESTFPMLLHETVKAIIHHAGTTLQQEVQAWALDQSEIPVSRYAADLPFVDNGVTISPDPSTWLCQKYNVATDQGVWLNLSDGFMGGGRKHWDGSGGTNGALEHYQETECRYPLVVKLGTIHVVPSPSTGSYTVQADCYSYASDEDGPVIVPNLKELLQKRGIDVMAM
jgi:ubiquitin carboxyl-terminal hydrolase 5/13